MRVGTANEGRKRHFAALPTSDAAPIFSTSAPEDRLHRPMYPLHLEKTHCGPADIHCAAHAYIVIPRVYIALSRTSNAAPEFSRSTLKDRLQGKEQGMRDPTDQLYRFMFPLRPKKTLCRTPNIQCIAPARFEPPRVRFADVNVSDAGPVRSIAPGKRLIAEFRMPIAC